MLRNLSFTFGTRNVLKKFITDHADRELILLGSSANDDQGLQLVDASGKPSLFSAGLEYQVTLHQGATDWRGFYSFSYFKFDQDTADVFDAKVNRLAAGPLPEGMRALYVMVKPKDRGSYSVLTIWDDSQAYSLWRHSPAFAPLNTYATSANHYHASSYHRITLKDAE